MILLKLFLKNPLRHRLRTVLTVLGITIAILSFGMLRTIIDAWYSGVEASSATRLVTRNAVSIIFPLPFSYGEKIRQVQGVSRVAYGNWFGGIYIDEKNFFASFATDPTDTYFDLYPEYILDPAQKAAYAKDRKGCVIGRKLAARYGWKIGDGVTLKGTIYPGNWDYVIRGIYSGRYRSVDETQFIFHWDYLNETMKKTAPSRADQVGFYMLSVSRPDQSADVSASIDGMFKNSLAETITETEKAFQQGFLAMTEAIVVAIKLVSFVVIIIIMAVAANTMAMTARERIGEYAVLKTLGFGRYHIAGLIFGESMMVAAAGCVLGMGLTFPAARMFASQLSQYFPIFFVTRQTLYMQAGAALIVGVVAGIFPAWRAVRIRIADGLRRVG